MEFLQEWGILGLFVGTFLSSTLLPLSPGILVAGFLYAGVSPFKIFVVATAGNWLGSLSTYLIGWLGKWEWIERWFKVTPAKLYAQQAKVARWGSLLAFMVWLPIVGDLFALALGFYRVSPAKCAVFILIGKACRFLAYIFVMMYAGESLLGMKTMHFL
ncbi:MAG: VTT domain-containing protein [Prevotellaceae bacterium]|jgi:membrane protein YqaA with SNARE-associated domain|nr:VTT domain-containing protein [Prevotellaceae bacterium]